MCEGQRVSGCNKDTGSDKHDISFLTPLHYLFMCVCSSQCGDPAAVFWVSFLCLKAAAVLCVCICNSACSMLTVRLYVSVFLYSVSCSWKFYIISQSNWSVHVIMSLCFACDSLWSQLFWFCFDPCHKALTHILSIKVTYFNVYSTSR